MGLEVAILPGANGEGDRRTGQMDSVFRRRRSTSELNVYAKLVFTVIIGGPKLTLCQGCLRREEGVERRVSTSEIELS